MKCTIPKSALVKLIDRCRPATDSRSEQVASQCLLLTADREQQTLNSFASKIALSLLSEEQCAVEQEGRCALNAEKLRSAVKAMPDGAVTFKTDPKKHSTTLTCAGSKRRYTLHGMNPEHYPERPEWQSLEKYSVPGKLLKEAITRVKGAAAPPSEGRMQLSGVLLEFTENDFKAVAMDGYKFCRFVNKGHYDHTAGTLLLTAGAVTSVLGIMEADEDVTFSYTASTGFAASGTSRVIFSFPEARFPDWKMMIRNAPEKCFCSFDVDQALTAIQGVTAVAKEDIILELTGNMLRIALTKNSEAQGEDMLQVNAAEDGASFQVSCASEYLVEILSGIGGGIAKLFFDPTADSPLVFLSDDDFVGMVQPRRPE